MLDMLTFWITYGALMLFFWGYVVYWMFPLVDKLIENWTDGDYKNPLSYKFRNPFLNKFGLMEKTDKYGNSDENGEWNYMFEGHEYFASRNNRWSAIIVFWLSVSGFMLNITFTLGSWSKYSANSAPDWGLHYVSVNLSEWIATNATPYVLLAISLFVANSLIKRIYKFGKRVKVVMDKIDKGLDAE